MTELKEHQTPKDYNDADVVSNLNSPKISRCSAGHLIAAQCHPKVCNRSANPLEGSVGAKNICAHEGAVRLGGDNEGGKKNGHSIRRQQVWEVSVFCTVHS